MSEDKQKSEGTHPKSSEKKKSHLKSILKSIVEYANVGVAFATLVLAIGTFWMALETKRLADISVEQFKIKSYPDFMVETDNVSFEENKLIQGYKVHNKSELTAHSVTILLVNAWEEGKQYVFRTVDKAFYESDEHKTTLDFETKIYRGSYKQLKSRTSIPIGHDSTASLKHALLYVRFKVPYDNKFRYEIFGYILKEDYQVPSKAKTVWQGISQKDLESLIERMRKTEGTGSWSDKLKMFFADYEHKTN